MNMNSEGWGWITIDCIQRIQFRSKANIILVTILKISKFVGAVNTGDWAEEE